MKMRPVPGWPDYMATADGNIYSVRTKKMLKPHVFRGSRMGYMGVTLSKNGRRYHAMVRVLIGRAFLGTRPKGREVCTLDSNPKNAAASNLAYRTRSQIMQQRFDNGRAIRPTGALHPMAKLTDEIVSTIRDSVAAGMSQRAAATYFGIDQSNVSRIISRQTWTHI